MTNTLVGFDLLDFTIAKFRTNELLSIKEWQRLHLFTLSEFREDGTNLDLSKGLVPLGLYEN